MDGIMAKFFIALGKGMDLIGGEGQDGRQDSVQNVKNLAGGSSRMA